MVLGSKNNAFKPLKPPLSPEEQREKIRQHGLVLESESDEQAVVNLFKRYNYYFTTGYVLHKRDSNHIISGINATTFIDLIERDCALRELCFPLLSRIEVRLKRIIPYVHSRSFNRSDAYLDEGCFRKTEYSACQTHQSLITNLQIEIDRCLKSNYYKPVKHNIENYGKLPFWVAVDLLSLAEISKFYSLFRNSERSLVLKELDIIRDSQIRLHNASNVNQISAYDFRTWLHLISLFRNSICHQDRLYNYQWPISITPCKMHQDSLVSTKMFFSAIYVSLCTLGDSCFNKAFIGDLKTLMSRYPNLDIDLLGFNADWENILSSLA